MNFDESRGTFEDIIRNSAPATAEIALALRHLIQDLFEEVTEVHADYGISAGRMGDVFVYICPVKTYVRLEFYYGADLPDPARLLVGTGKRLRHIKLHAGSDLKRPEVQGLLIAAFRERKSALKS